MLKQPSFGRRLKELRRQRGLSQVALAGTEISTGYLSRLESGARQPTERVITYLTERLQVDPSAFDETPRGRVLTQALSIATSTDSDTDDAVDGLIAALHDTRDEDSFVRWQALWLIAHHWRRRGEHAQEQSCLEELVRLADELAQPELRCRARAELARSLRSTGEMSRAIGTAVQAYQLAKETRLSVTDTGKALQILASVEAEMGRLPDARAHVDELVGLAEEGMSEVLKTEALWSAATVRSRQGDHESAREFLERAMRELHAQVDLTLWVRLRLAATSLYLQAEPPLVVRGRECLAEAETAVSLVGTPVLRQEMLMLRAYLAFHEERLADARTACDQLTQGELLLTYRDRIRLSVLDSRLLVLEGHREKGFAQLRKLAEEARGAANMDLAADIWRILAEALAHAQGGDPGD